MSNIQSLQIETIVRWYVKEILNAIEVTYINNYLKNEMFMIFNLSKAQNCLKHFCIAKNLVNQSNCLRNYEYDSYWKPKEFFFTI